MVERKVRKPRCHGCAFFLPYREDVPKKVKGVLLKSGYQYCTAGKRAWQFTKSEARKTSSLPSRCPRVNIPADLRVYCWKDGNTEFLHALFMAQGVKFSPSEHQYAMRWEGKTEMTAYQFQKLVKQQRPSELLGLPLHTNEIVEIDDGLEPYCFYLVDRSTARCVYFSGEKARENQLEVKHDETNL